MKKLLYISAIALAVAACDKVDTDGSKNADKHGESQDQPAFDDYTFFGNAYFKNYDDYYDCGADNITLVLYNGKADDEGNPASDKFEALTIDLVATQPGLTAMPEGTFTASSTEGEKGTFHISEAVTWKEYIDMVKEAFGIDLSDQCPEDQLNSLAFYDYSCYFSQLDSLNYSYGSVEAGTVTVSLKGAVYTVYADIQIEGELCHYAYIGAIDEMEESEDDPYVDPEDDPEDPDDPDDPEDEDYDYDSIPENVVTDNVSEIAAAYYGTYYNEDCDDYCIFIYTDDTAEEICLEILTEPGDGTELQAGTYTVGEVYYTDDAEPGMCVAFDDEYYYGTYYAYGEYYWYLGTSGKVKVTKTAKGYDIEWNIKDDDEEYGGSFRGSYSGPIEIYDETESIEESSTKAAANGRPASRKAEFSRNRHNPELELKRR